MAAWQVLQPAADQDAAALPRFIGIREIHILFRQQRAQMLVNFLQWGVFEGCIAALLRLAFLDFVESGPVLDDLDAGELFQDPALCRAVGELGLFRVEALIHCDHAFELCGISAGVKRHLFNQRQNRRGAVRCWRERSPLSRCFAMLGLEREISPLFHQNSSLPSSGLPSLCGLPLTHDSRSNSASASRFGPLSAASPSAAWADSSPPNCVRFCVPSSTPYSQL
jgi:hypothetical protein